MQRDDHDDGDGVALARDESEPLSAPEVYRRLPLIRNIEDGQIRTETVRLTQNAPDYFWTVPASTSGYHPEPCRGERGLWAHTLMVAQAVEDLLWTYEDRGFLYDGAADHARAAAILHDQRKNGDPADPQDTSTSDHDLRMGLVIDQNSTLPNKVSRCVTHHMGPSYDGPVPEPGCVEDLVHMADYAASRANWRIAVDADLPIEMQALGIGEV